MVEIWPRRSWFICLLDTDDLRGGMRCSDVSKAKWTFVFEKKHTVPAHESPLTGCCSADDNYKSKRLITPCRQHMCSRQSIYACTVHGTVAMTAQADQ